jgi:hypothetical protein
MENEQTPETETTAEREVVEEEKEPITTNSTFHVLKVPQD